MRKVVIQLAIVSLLLTCFIPVVSGELSRKQIQEAQKLLKNAGFNPGPIDGILGPRTRAAIRQYQAKHGLPETGSLDEATRAVLDRKDRRQPSDETTKFGVDKGPQKGATKVTGLPKKPKEALVLTRPDLMRLAVMMVFGLGAWGFGGLIVVTAVGAFLAVLIHWTGGVTWILSFQIGLAVVYVLPIFFRILLQNVGLLVLQALLLGLPTFLVSRYVFDSGCTFAVCYGIVTMHLVPAAIVRTLILLGIIDEPVRPSFRVLPDGYSSWSPTNRYPYSSDSPQRSSSSSPISSR